MKKKKFYNEDRIIICLDIIRWKLVEIILSIDKQLKYLERIKKLKSS